MRPRQGAFFVVACIVALSTLDYDLIMRRLLMMGMVLAASLCYGETGYRIVHPDGTVEYTDQPVNGAEAIPMPEITTYPAPPPSTPSAGIPGISTKPATGQQRDGYLLFTISSPQDEQTVWFNEKGMTVSLQLQPGLNDGDEVIIRMDGVIVASGTATTYTIKDVFRGTHTLSAAIADSQGSVIKETGPITFILRQHSVLHRQPKTLN